MTTFPVNRGKQLIAASPDGYLIGDGIVFHLEQDYFRVVGPPVIGDWTQYHAETSGYDIEIDRDETVTFREGGPRIYIYQVQGVRKSVVSGKRVSVRVDIGCRRVLK